MSWPAYSERFLHHSAEGWWYYEVPANKRLILTHIDVANATNVVAGFRVVVGPIIVAWIVDLAAYTSRTVTTRQVAYQGEELGLFIAGGTHASLSGYLLDDNSGRTGPPLAPTNKPGPPEPRPRPGPHDLLP